MHRRAEAGKYRFANYQSGNMKQKENTLTEQAEMAWRTIEDQVKQSLQEIEEKRKSVISKYMKRGLKYGLFLAILFYVVSVAVEYVYVYHFGAGIYLALAAFVATWIVIFDYGYSEMKGLYGSRIMTLFHKAIATDKEESESASKTIASSAPFNNIGNSSIFSNKTNKVSTHLDDGMMGKTGGNRFYFGEVKYTNQYNNSWFSRWFKDNLLFQGLILVADFNKECQGRIMISTKHKWRTMNLDGSFKKVVTEDSRFNSIFRIRSLDVQEAFYALSPSLMERISNLQEHIRQSINERHMILYLKGKRIYILIPTMRNRFEPGLLSKLTLESVRNDFFTLKTMLSIVDELNLNTRIWTKE